MLSGTIILTSFNKYSTPLVPMFFANSIENVNSSFTVLKETLHNLMMRGYFLQ